MRISDGPEVSTPPESAAARLKDASLALMRGRVVTANAKAQIIDVDDASHAMVTEQAEIVERLQIELRLIGKVEAPALGDNSLLVAMVGMQRVIK